MSDAPTDSGAASPPAAPDEASPPVVQPPADAGGGDPFTDLPADQALFPRSYVEKLRTEGHKYRTEAQTAAQRAAEYDRVYADYADDDRKAWFDLAETWKVDPAAAAAWMQEVASKVLGDVAANATKGDDQPEADEVDIEGLTPEGVQKMIDAALQTREQAAAQEKMVSNIYDEIRAAGITDDADQLWVLARTNGEYNGDLPAAIAAFRARDQKVIDDYLAGRTGGNHPIPAPNGGVAANQSTEISSFEEARKATDAFLRAQGAAGP